MLQRKTKKYMAEHGGGAEAPFESDRPPAEFLLVLMILLTIVLFVVGFIGAEILRRINEANLESVFTGRPYAELAEQRALDEQRLSEYAQSSDGVSYRIPVSVAKDELLRSGSTGPLK